MVHPLSVVLATSTSRAGMPGPGQACPAIHPDQTLSAVPQNIDLQLVMDTSMTKANDPFHFGKGYSDYMSASGFSSFNTNASTGGEYGGFTFLQPQYYANGAPRGLYHPIYKALMTQRSMGQEDRIDYHQCTLSSLAIVWAGISGFGKCRRYAPSQRHYGHILK